MVRYLEGKEKLLTRKLWEAVFSEDSESFVDYYYREKVKDNRILAVVEDRDEILAMLQLNPYLLQVCDRRWRVDYLVGVATRTERRHQGLMRQLLKRMMTDMRGEEMPFCFLMPADEAIYRPFGFTWIFDQLVWELKPELPVERRVLMRTVAGAEAAAKTTAEAAAENPRQLSWISEWMNRWLKRRYQVYAVRSKEYLARLLKEIASENGTLEALYDGDSMIGFSGSWGIEKKEQRLLYCEAPYIREAAAPKPAIMARIITPEQFVKVIHLREEGPEKELTLRLKLTDPLIPENDGLWNWHLNRETSWLERCVEERERSGAVSSRTDLVLTITELTSWLFGYDTPEAAKPYQERIETIRGVFLDEVV